MVIVCALILGYVLGLALGFWRLYIAAPFAAEFTLVPGADCESSCRDLIVRQPALARRKTTWFVREITRLKENHHFFWEDDENGESIAVSVGPAQRGGVPCLIQIETQLATGRLLTLNGEGPLAHRPDPSETRLRLPYNFDVDELLQVHRTARVRLFPDISRIPTPVADPLRWLRSSDETLQRQVEAGYWIIDGQFVRWGAKGAFLEVCGSMWPIRSLRLAWIRYKARRMLRRLGLPMEWACGTRLPNWDIPQVQTEELSLRCLHCGYSLTGLVSNHCPECGRDYDLDVLRSWAGWNRWPQGLTQLVAAFLRPASWIILGVLVLAVIRPRLAGSHYAASFVPLLAALAFVSLKRALPASRSLALMIMADRAIAKGIKQDDLDRRALQRLTRALFAAEMAFIAIILASYSCIA